MAKVTICLCLQVYDDFEKVKECLESTKQCIDFISMSHILAPEPIQGWAKDNSIPCVMSTNIMIEAKKAFPDATYYLLLDSDMTVVVDKTFAEEKQALTFDSYELCQYIGSKRSIIVNLLKAFLDWTCNAVTRDKWYVNGRDHTTCGILYELEIDCPSSRYIRVAALLANPPEEFAAHYLFCSAEVMYIAKDYKGALKKYMKRSTMGGDTEEVYYSLYMKGNCYRKLRQSESAEQAYLAAWIYRPTRREGLYNLTRMYRLREEYSKALLYGVMGIQIPKSDDKLFVNYRIENFLLEHEVATTAYYVPGQLQFGGKVMDGLMARIEKIDKHYKEFIIRDSKYYANEIKVKD